MMTSNPDFSDRLARALARAALCVGLLAAGFLWAATTAAAEGRHQPRVCTQTAGLQYSACRFEIADDVHVGLAKCLNVVDDDERDECRSEVYSEKQEAKALCRAQRVARKQMCRALGEAAYEPDMDPGLFQDPRSPSRTNPYFPLGVGNRWVFDDEEERIEIVVLDETKRVEEIDCIVVNDRVFIEGKLVEDTDDWFGLRKDATVDYCGEAVQDFEFFEGDDPEEAQLVSIDGSFKAGEGGAKAGTAFLGEPTVGRAYRQEWDAGNAEDNGKVLSTDYAYGKDAELDEFVPKELAELMCADGDCVVIQDTSSLEPDAFERKYYARGIGKFLEIKPDEGAAVPLIECNFDARCQSLPID